MVSKSQQKQILQLKQKKYRQKFGLFVAEGTKVVEELLASNWKCSSLFSQKDHFHPQAIPVDLKTMKQITHFKTPSPFLGVFEIPEPPIVPPSPITLAVDGVGEPGNLGTILRLCDWFGVDELICSAETVDCFNPKVVQASMGSIARVSCRYETNLASCLTALEKPIFGADGTGKSLYQTQLPKAATYVFGSESHGLSKVVKGLLEAKIAIPNLRSGQGAESLNVATATAIFLSEIFRGAQSFKGDD